MDKLNIGMVGLNFGIQMIERHILSGPGEPYFDLAAVCRRDKTKCDEAAAKFGVKAYYTIDDLLADDEIPVIVDMTGPIGRAERIRSMIEAGKHVMTTKPFELGSQAAAAVLSRARELGRIVHLNSPVPAANANGEPAETATFDHQQLSHCYQWDTFHKAIHGEHVDHATPDSVIVNGIKVIEAMQRAQDSGTTEAV